MRFQFGIKSIMLAVAVVAVSCGGLMAVWPLWHRGTPVRVGMILLDFVLNAPLWFPIAFVAFALGRKRLSVSMVVVFAFLEAAAIGIAYGGVFLFVPGFYQ